MTKVILLIISIYYSFTVCGSPFPSSFTANWVDIMILHNGRFRVIIKYTNLRIGEYREAYVDFTSKKEAIEVFQKLALGAEFYWGDRKTIHFRDTADKPKPY